jgi:hypothetical protein
MSAKHCRNVTTTALAVGACLVLSSSGAQAQLILDERKSLSETIRKVETYSEKPTSTETTVVYDAVHARTADYASEADHAERANYADHAGYAEEANHAEEADYADRAAYADEAGHAVEADHADRADHATTADEATTLSPHTCEEGEILRKDVDGWICVPMASTGGAVLYAQQVRAPAYWGAHYVFGVKGYEAPEAVAMVLPRDGLLRNLFILPDASRHQPDIVTAATVFINGAETELSVTHDSTADGVDPMSNLDGHVFVYAGDTLAFLVEDAGSTCVDGSPCSLLYTIAVSLD